MIASGVPVTPPPPSMSPARSTVPALDYVPGHVTATVQQHAAQIHKLIAGLDFLEAHIIRQDQVVEGLQKQLLSVSSRKTLHGRFGRLSLACWLVCYGRTSRVP